MVTPTAMHPGQLDVPLATARALVAEQFPQWADLDVAPGPATGTVHAIYRIGSDLAARFPLQAEDVPTARRRLHAEAAANREILGRSRFPVPEPVALGEPGHGYPMPWAVQTWLPGRTADVADPGASPDFAHDLALFIADLRSLDTAGRRFDRPGRGGDLRAHDAWVQTCLGKSQGLLDVPRLGVLWSRLRELPRTAPDAMTHGDLMPGNVLVFGGRLAGVLDCGDVGPADPALDLVGAWHLLDAGPRRLLRDDLKCEDLEWERGKAWAVEQALGLVWYYVRTNPTMSRTGQRTLRRILADEDGADEDGADEPNQPDQR